MTRAPDPRPRLRDPGSAEVAGNFAEIAGDARDQVNRMAAKIAGLFGTTPDNDWIFDAVWNAEDPRAAVEALIAAQDGEDQP